MVYKKGRVEDGTKGDGVVRGMDRPVGLKNRLSRLNRRLMKRIVKIESVNNRLMWLSRMMNWMMNRSIVRRIVRL